MYVHRDLPSHDDNDDAIILLLTVRTERICRYATYLIQIFVYMYLLILHK